MAQPHSQKARKRRSWALPGGRSAVIACVVVVLALAGAAAWKLSQPPELLVGAVAEEDVGSSAKEESEPAKQVAATKTVVHVDGAVIQPGVYTLKGDDLRIDDAVSAAGGLAEDADTQALNLASPLEDGQKIHVPRVGELVAETASDASGGAGASAAPAAGAGLININTATAAELDELPGVGEATAQAIVEERERGGAFSSIEDLMRVSGIGEKKFAKLQDKICV